MKAVIYDLNIKGDVVIPPSKSLSHRAIIAASLSEGITSTVSNLIFSNDILATIDACRGFGASIEVLADSVIITGSKVERVSDTIDCNESGSTVRFMIPICLVADEKVTFTGNNHLVNRPLDSYLKIFKNKGIKYSKGENYLPLTVENGLKSGTYSIRGDISSQFITGLLYALPLLDGPSTIKLETPLMSKGYVDLTLDVLSKYGIKIRNNDYKSFSVLGNQKYVAKDYYVEGDYSQSAFFMLAQSLGADINLLGMNENSLQGDKKIIEDINNFGGNAHFENDKLICKPFTPKGTNIDMAQSPDLGPALSVLASVSEGDSSLYNAERLRIKECDRITDMAHELELLGANVTETESTMDFKGVSSLTNAVLDSHNDHRVVMALTMARLITKEPITILNAEAINKSFPHFFTLLRRLGADITYE